MQRLRDERDATLNMRHQNAKGQRKKKMLAKEIEFMYSQLEN